MINDLSVFYEENEIGNEADEVAGERNLWQRLQKKMNEWMNE